MQDPAERVPALPSPIRSRLRVSFVNERAPDACAALNGFATPGHLARATLLPRDLRRQEVCQTRRAYSMLQCNILITRGRRSNGEVKNLIPVLVCVTNHLAFA
jgi:hypothetical protein